MSRIHSHNRQVKSAKYPALTDCCKTHTTERHNKLKPARETPITDRSKTSQVSF